MVVPNAEYHVAARSIAHPLGKILARVRWALTLARLPLVAQSTRLRPPPFTVLSILFTPLLTPGRAGPVTPARLDPTPTLRRTTTLFVAIASLRICRREQPFAALEQTTPRPTACPTVLTAPKEMMK